MDLSYKLLSYLCYIRIIFKYKIRGIKRFFTALKHSISWGIFMFHDEDYDFYYIYRLLERKIRDMKNHIIKHNIIDYADFMPAMERIEEILKSFINPDNDYAWEQSKKDKEELFNLLKDNIEQFWD